MSRAILPFKRIQPARMPLLVAASVPLLGENRPLGACVESGCAAGTLFASFKRVQPRIARDAPGEQPAVREVLAMKRANVKQHEVFDAAQTRLRLLISALEAEPADDDLESLDFTESTAEAEEDGAGEPDQDNGQAAKD